MYAEQIIEGLDGPLFRKQRELIDAIHRSGDRGWPIQLSHEDVELVLGVLHLMDEIADCAHDVYGKDCLLE